MLKGKKISKLDSKSVPKKPEKEKKLNIKLRVNILFAVIFSLFLVLLGRLYYMQVIDKSFYADKLKETGANTTVTTSMPRGQIFDATGKLLASTSTVPSITFERKASITADEMRQNAVKLVPILQSFVDTSGLTSRDLKDYFLSDPKNLSLINAELPASKQVDSQGRRLSEATIYSKLINLVKDSQIQYSGDDLVAAELYKMMNGTKLYASSNIVSGDISSEQQAAIAGQLSSLPGISFGSDWEHSIDQSNLLSPLLGTISTTKSGLPKDEVASLLKQGYSLNDRVGLSYLEKGYESDLQGKKEITQIAVDSKGQAKEKTLVQAGANGKNLKLTVNLDFENGVQQILQNDLSKVLNATNSHVRGAYAVVLNSQTGAILSMNGLDRDTTTGTLTNNSLAPMIDSFIPGSTVKPGTLTAGWASNAISGNQIQDDQIIQIQGSNPITSYWGSSSPMPITAQQALEYSSNTYMVQVALKMLGQPYSPNMTINSTNTPKVYDELRGAYAQYGLGTSTGIDIPGETTGLVPSTGSEGATTGKLLQEAFGQFDNYSPLQLAQYAQTIANNGVRLAPHIVDGVYTSTDSSLGTLASAVQSKTMDKVNITQANMDTIHQGMHDVVYGGHSLTTGGLIGQGALTEIYAKTGTSEGFASNGDAITVNNAIAFAPGPSPQIAVGIMVPDTSVVSHVNQDMVRDIVNLAVQMKIIK
ncbi:MAG: penicillin-binding protein 2 [Streptococcaceae bacterium]|jgi:penicillin-binding protein 2B|nr:penicillin-binding protein 2 [Streptococcaceae bacterium]